MDILEAQIKNELERCEASGGVQCDKCPMHDECIDLVSRSPSASLNRKTYREFIISFYIIRAKKRRMLNGQKAVSEGL